MGRYKSAAVSTRAVKSARQSSSKPPRDEEMAQGRRQVQATTHHRRFTPIYLHYAKNYTKNRHHPTQTRASRAHPTRNASPPKTRCTLDIRSADPRPPCPCKNKIYVEAPLCRTPEVRRVGCPSLEGTSALFALVAPQDGRGDDSELAGGVVRSEGKWRASSSFPLMPPSLSPR